MLAASLLDLAEQLQAEELRGLMGAQKLQRPRPIDCARFARVERVERQRMVVLRRPPAHGLVVHMPFIGRLVS